MPVDAIRKRSPLTLSLIGLAVAAIISTIGFYILGLERHRSFIDALYHTAVIFSTVGHLPGDFNHAEELWSLLMIVFGIGAAVYAFGSVMAVITSGQIRKALGRRQVINDIQKLSNHYIVCGFGKMGQSICQQLAIKKQSFVVVDRDNDHVEFAENLGYLYLQGDASDEMTLHVAGIERAKGLVSALPDDATNTFVTLTARGLNENLNIISRSEREATNRRLERAGADRVICTPVITASKVTRMLLHPALDDVIDATVKQDIAFNRIHINQLKSTDGQTISDLKITEKYGIIVLAIEKDDHKLNFNPPDSHVLEPDDQLVLVGPNNAFESLLASCE